MEYLILTLVVVFCIVLLLFIQKRYTQKTYPRKTGKLLNSVLQLQEIGLQKTDDGYKGMYRNFFVSVFATTSIKSYVPYGGDRFQVWVSIAPQAGQLDKLGGFFGKYIVSGQTNGFATIGFMVNAKATPDAQQEIIDRLNVLVNILNDNGVKAFVM